MATIEGALGSVADSLARLVSRFGGSEDRAIRLFRLKLKVREASTRVALSPDANDRVRGAVIDALVHLAADLSELPSDGGPRFDPVVDAVDRELTAVMDALDDART